MRKVTRFGKPYPFHIRMRLATIILGCILTLTFVVVLVSSLSESSMFADFVTINWNNHSTYVDEHLTNFGNVPQYQTHVYGIVIDAGSTGTRIHVYKFVYNPRNVGHVYDLVEETLEEVRPGLSSYANNVSGARKGLQFLLSVARKRVPLSFSRLTYVTLRATAGLRLLPANQSEALLNESRACIKDSGFLIDRVDIMDGLEEAVQAWVTVNYIVGRIHIPSMSLGIMDLGGASTQVTFVPGRPETLTMVPHDHRHTLVVSGVPVNLYTHSYLGLGLMSARLAILSIPGGLNDSSLYSSCMPYKYQGHWTHGGVRYTVTSTAHRNMSIFDECYNSSRKLVTEIIPVLHPIELRSRQFYLFSYFYDRAKDAGIDPERLPLHLITVEDYRRVAMKICSQNYKLNFRKPFLCLDLVYIYTLLKDGYGFKSSSYFYLAKKVNNIELGWSLGVVFDLLYRTELV